MHKRYHNVTLIDEDGTNTVIPIPRRYARQMSASELFDTANWLASLFEDAPISNQKAMEEEVSHILRYCL